MGLIDENWTCAFPFLGPSTECYHRYDGMSYTGTVSVTWRGWSCRDWSRWSRWYRDSHFPDGTIEAAANYCRNPKAYAPKPWCYYNSYGYWAYCDIPRCDGTDDNPDASQNGASDDDNVEDSLSQPSAQESGTLTHWGRDKMAASCRRHFQSIFEWRWLWFHSHFTSIYS